MLKKILSIVLLSLILMFAISSFLFFIFNCSQFAFYCELLVANDYHDSLMRTIINILFCAILSLLSAVICIMYLINRIIKFNVIRYTYEEYKAKMAEKKALKQEKKKEKLKQELNKLEKGE